MYGLYRFVNHVFMASVPTSPFPIVISLLYMSAQDIGVPGSMTRAIVYRCAAVQQYRLTMLAPTVSAAITLII